MAFNIFHEHVGEFDGSMVMREMVGIIKIFIDKACVVKIIQI